MTQTIQRYTTASMPHGSSALFCRDDDLRGHRALVHRRPRTTPEGADKPRVQVEVPAPTSGIAVSQRYSVSTGGIDTNEVSQTKCAGGEGADERVLNQRRTVTPCAFDGRRAATDVS